MAKKSDIQKPKNTDYISEGDDAITANANVLETVFDNAESAQRRASAAIGEIGTAAQYLLKSADDSIYAIPMTDRAGYAAGGVTPHGRFNFEKPATVAGVDGVMFEPISENDYAFAFVDRDGYMAAGITADGRFVTAKAADNTSEALAIGNALLGYTKTRSDAITTIGDSLTYGYFDGSAGPTSDSWPAKLQTQLGSDVTVTNVAYAGYTVDEEAIRVGALELPITVTGGTIPASGPVEVSTATVVGWRDTEREISFTGSLNGVDGTLSRSSDGTLTFTRSTAGASTPIPDGTRFESQFAGHDDEILIVMLGRNDASYKVSGSDSTIPDHVVNGVSRIVDWQSRDLSKVLVLSVTNTQTETIGTGGHAIIKEINDRLSAKYGPRYLDIRAPLVNDALDALGITPTQEDLAAIAADAIPPTLMGDNTHWNRDAHTFVAGLIHDYLTERDWTH